MGSTLRTPAFKTIRYHLITLFSFVLFFTCLATTAWAKELIKAGIFQNKPVVYDEDGPKGLFVDVLNHVAVEEFRKGLEVRFMLNRRSV